MEGIFKRYFRVLRRKFYFKFRKAYIKESIAKRKGYCRNCGSCCSSALIPCEHFDYSTNQCKIWRKKGYESLSQNCKNYPFDEKDMVPASKLYCGFYWEKEDGRR